MDPPPSRLFKIEYRDNEHERNEITFAETVGAVVTEATPYNVRRALTLTVISALTGLGLSVSERSPLVVDTRVNFAPRGSKLRIHRGFRFQVMSFRDSYYLCLNHQLVVRLPITVAGLADIDSSFHLGPSQNVQYRDEGNWRRGRLAGVESQQCQLVVADNDEIDVAAEDVVPRLTHAQLLRLAPSIGIDAGALERDIKRLSFLTVANGARARFAAIDGFAQALHQTVFPVRVAQTTVSLNSEPAVLSPPWFDLADDLREPDVSFDHIDRSKRTRGVIDGLIQFGAYQKATSPTRLLVLTTGTRKLPTERLIGRLNKGAKGYPGAEKTFGSEFHVQEVIVCPTTNDYDEQLRRFVRAPGRQDIDLVLACVPKGGDASDSSHPYFRLKNLLLREGLVSQMVDDATLFNPDWRDLNLALNMHAKAGLTPWVLDTAIESVDLFIGLSSSQIIRSGKVVRMMGYVNLFDSYGRWKFYQGDSTAFSFEDRLRNFDELVRNSLASYKAQNGGGIRSIHIHLTKPFSREERVAISQAVHAIESNATIVFVWINPSHPVRMFNLSESSDGQVRRALLLSDESSEYESNRGYLSTTGTNIYGQKGMGTPVPLELTVWTEPEDARVALRDAAQPVLSLTRLNWSSSRSFSREPVTTKYAGSIARLMTVLMEDSSFSVSANLRNKPWFL